MSNKIHIDDLVDAGFERLDPRLVEKRPPAIKWGMLYQRKTPEQKMRYLERLASSMNQAAAKIQSERNELGRLCELKEAQLAQLSVAMRQNNDMIQSEVTRMNADRRQYRDEIAKLRAEVRALKAERDE